MKTETKVKATLPKLIAGLEHFRRAKINSFTQAAFCCCVVAKEGMTYNQMSSIMKGQTQHNLRCLAFRLQELGMVRIDKCYEKPEEGKPRRLVTRLYSTPYLRDVVSIIESDIWMK